jgi:hypothetical protein
MSEETGVKVRAAARSNEDSAAASWRHYPCLDAAIETERPAVLASIEKTCGELNRLSRGGTDREKERARTALVAYGKALELYHHLADLRDEALRVASNMRR